jgi:hypothetical protein
MLLSSDNNHHAVLLVGEPEQAKLLLWEWFLHTGVVTVGNPDFFYSNEESFGIDEARAMGARALSRAFGEAKVFVLMSRRMTSEAQNALLKTLEDPPLATRFFIIAREESLLLPTLRSRMMVIRIHEYKDIESGSAKEFLSLSTLKRLEFAKKFVDREKDLAVFLDDLLRTLKEVKAQSSTLKRVLEVRRYASDRSASSRLVVEHLALVI